MKNLSGIKAPATSSTPDEGVNPRVYRSRRGSFLTKYQLHKLIQWTFLLLVFFIPLETLEIGPTTSGSLTIPRLLGVALFALALLSQGYAFKRLPRAGYFFFGYLAVFFMSCFFVSEQFMRPAISLFITLLQLFILFWIAVSLFFRNEEFVRKSCMAYGFGCFILALCGLLNIGGMAEISTERGMQRLAVEGLNPNYLACMLAVSVALSVGLFLTDSLKKYRHKILLVVLVVPQVMMIVSTGSRGALLGLILALFLYVTPFGSSRKRLVAMIGGAIAMCAIAYVALLDPVVLQRVEETTATMGGERQESRTEIYYKGVLLLLERPIFGWGPKENEAKLGEKTGKYLMNSHNVYLQVLLQTGIVGGGLLIMGIGLCLYSAWSNRKTWLGLIPTAALTVVLVVNVFHEFLPRKVTWFVFALASTSLMPSSRYDLRTRRRVGKA